MARDYYAEAITIADDAARVGLDDLSEELRQAIREGFTSTEILMRIRWVLTNARAVLSVHPDLRSRSQALIGAIDEAFR